MALGYGLQVAGYGLRVTSCELRVSAVPSFKFRVSPRLSGIFDKFHTIDSRLKDRSIANIQYLIVNYRGCFHGKMAE